MPAAKKKPKQQKKRGRPSKYTQELAALICERVATNPCGIKKITTLYPELPTMETIFQWRHKYKDFSESYARAKLLQADLLAESCLDISDDDSSDIRINEDGFEAVNHEFIARSRVRIDTRKWLASKLLPKQYGEQKLIDDLKADNERVKEELNALRSKLTEQHKKEY